MACEPKDQDEAIEEAIQGLAKASVDRDKVKLILAGLLAEKAVEESRLKALQAVPADAEQQAWCADYTENLSGEVGTAEIPGEGNTRIIIRPGYSGAATYTAARDGQLFHRPGMSPAQAYFNAAILPGWQKFKPTYRVGTLTAVSEATDTGSVDLAEETSSAYDLPINQTKSLSGVPIVYMDCNAKAFEVGDSVLVEFQGQNWGSPRIVGFAANPKECPVEVDWPTHLVLYAESFTTKIVKAKARGTKTLFAPGTGDWQLFEFSGVSYWCSPKTSADEVTLDAATFDITGTWQGYSTDTFNELADVALYSSSASISTASGSGQTLFCYGDGGLAYALYDVRTYNYNSAAADCPGGYWTTPTTDPLQYTGTITYERYHDDVADFEVLWTQLTNPAEVTLTHTASEQTRVYQEAGFADPPGPGTAYGVWRKYNLVEPT